MSVNLTPRLSAVASLVKGGGIIADIGTDHGYLPITLVKEGKVNGAIAADINKRPLDNARKSIEDEGLTDKITLRLSDGLSQFYENEVNEIVFAGMGGTLIADKLRETPWIKNKNLHFIFQPQSRAEDLRRYLFENGFEIQNEVATHEGRRFYIAFDAVYSGKKALFTEGDCFIGKLPKTEDSIGHLTHQLTRLKEKNTALKLKGENTEMLETIIREIEDFIHA